MSTPPFSQMSDLFMLAENGSELRLEPAAPVRAAIAEWAGLAGLDRLVARVRVSKAGENAFRYDAHLEADVVQSCVVTTEPVSDRIVRDVERSYVVMPKRRGRAATIELSREEPDDIETVESPVVDLAAPVLEELSLAIDPYPRAPGAVFQPPADAGDPTPAERPFAVLERLKARSGAKGKARKARKP